MGVVGLPRPPLGSPLPFRTEFWWESSIPLDQTGHAWLPAMLPILMRAHDPGVFSAPLDWKALENVPMIEAKLSGWWSYLDQIRIAAEKDYRVYPSGRGTGCFFSGGADSFYSVIDNLDEITHLIFVRQGFDIGSHERGLALASFRQLELAAAELGKELIVVHTNVRRMANKYSSWGPRYHGAALATVGLLHAERLASAIVPSSHAPRSDETVELHPWGSHPELDHLWSTSYFDIRHHGDDKYRHEKIAAIAKNNVALRYLRVCWENPDQVYNCGVCEKCVRTMVELYAYEALESCATLPNTVDLELLASQPLDGHGITFARRNAQLIEENVAPGDPVAGALRKSLAASGAAEPKA